VVNYHHETDTSHRRDGSSRGARGRQFSHDVEFLLLSGCGTVHEFRAGGRLHQSVQVDVDAEVRL